MLFGELPLSELADADGDVVQQLEAQLLLEADLLCSKQLAFARLPRRARGQAVRRAAVLAGFWPVIRVAHVTPELMMA